MTKNYMAGIDLGPDGYTTTVVYLRHKDGTVELVETIRRPMTEAEQRVKLGEYVATWSQAS